ncbi:hypothetical protein [Endothiovibrio diazotrophicus]
MIRRWLPPFLLLFATTVAAERFSPDPAPMEGRMRVDRSSDLCAVARHTADYLRKGADYDPAAIHGVHAPAIPFDLKRVLATLDFLCRTYVEDVRAKRPSRLHDAVFIERHFDRYRWHPDLERAHAHAARAAKAQAKMLERIPAGRILMTKYYVKRLAGVTERDADHPHALYGLPFDERGLTLEQAEARRAELTRYRYTKQQVLDGALREGGLAKPLVWLSRTDLEDVLMQGSAVVETANGVRHFNVHRNNGIAYDYTLAKERQGRYWYFKEVPGIMGYGKDADHKIEVAEQVTFAGDVADLGLGKLLMVRYPTDAGTVNRLGILADTGGAFDDNLFQLDLLAGAYHGWKEYHAANRHLPDFVEAWLLLLKPEFAGTAVDSVGAGF